MKQKTTEQIIEEIEMRIRLLIILRSMDAQSRAEELEDLLSWITQENNLDGVADD